MNNKPIKTLAAVWAENMAKLPTGRLMPVPAVDVIKLCRVFFYSGAGEALSIVFDSPDDMDAEQAEELVNDLLQEVNDVLEERRTILRHRDEARRKK